MRHIVFVDIIPTSSGAEFIKAAKNLGFYLTFASFDPNSYLKPGEQVDASILRYADHVLTVDTHHDIDGLIRTLREYSQKAPMPIDGVFASADYEVAQAAIVAKRLGLPGTNPSAVEVCRNKYFMRRLLQERGIPSPRYYLVDTPEEAQDAGEELGYPCVLKPVNLAGSDYVQLITEPGEFVDPLKFHKEHPGYSRRIKKFPQMLVEEYLEGPLLSVETISKGNEVQVLGITDRVLGTPPYFPELYGSFPARVTGADAAIEMTIQVLRAINYDFGPAHTELIVTKFGPRIVEINARLVGLTISFIMNQSLGYNVHEEILKMYMGLPTSFPVAYKGIGAIQQIVSSKTGKLQALDGVDAVTTAPGVIELSINKKVGDVVTELPQRNMDTLGHITVFGENREQMMHYMKNALAFLKVSVAEAEDSRSA